MMSVSQKKYRGVVAYQIPVSLLGVEFYGESADISFGVRRSAFSCYCGKPDKYVGFLANFRKELCAGIFCYISCDGKRPKRAGSLGVHAPFRDNLAVKVCHFFLKPYILHQHRASWAGSA